MSLVLDCSATMARIFPDEQTTEILAVFELVATLGAWVPELWHLEVANTLNVGIRRQRISATVRTQTLENLKALPIYVDAETSSHAWGRSLELADHYQLTLYDATYLELALRRHLPLATLDEELRRAALDVGIAVLGR